MTYYIVLNPVNLGVDLRLGISLIQLMLNFAHLQNTYLIERPSRNLLSKSLIGRLNLLARRSSSQPSTPLNLSIKPRIFKQLRRPNNSKPRRVPRLHSRNKRQLLPNRKRVLHTLNFVLGVIRIRSPRRANNRRQQRAIIPQRLSHSSGERDGLAALAVALEEVLDIRSNGIWAWHEHDVVVFRGAEGIVVEVVDYKAGAVGWEVDVEFEEEGYEGRGRGMG